MRGFGPAAPEERAKTIGAHVERVARSRAIKPDGVVLPHEETCSQVQAGDVWIMVERML